MIQKYDFAIKKCVCPLSPCLEKAIANKLSLLPPNEKATIHEVKCSSPSKSSNECGFFELLECYITKKESDTVITDFQFSYI